jgi:hypothetical protein
MVSLDTLTTNSSQCLFFTFGIHPSYSVILNIVNTMNSRVGRNTIPVLYCTHQHFFVQLLSNYVALLFNMIRINCTPQNVPGCSKQRGKKLVLRCVARHPLLASAKDVFFQEVKNEQRAVHQGPHALRKF